MLSQKTKRTKRAERGNALFLILIAVALFAALSYAITQSGRGGGTVTREQDLITAAAVVEYPATLKTAITRMIITGTPATNTGGTAVSLATATSGQTYQLFDGAGGAQTSSPPASGTAIPNWLFIDANRATTLGVWVEGVGTDTFGALGDTSRDAMAVLGGCNSVATDTTGVGCTTTGTTYGLTQSQCQAINKGLGQASPYTPAYLATAAFGEKAVATATEPAQGTGGATKMVGAGAQAAYVTGQPFSCISNSTTSGVTAPWIYYHVLIEN